MVGVIDRKTQKTLVPRPCFAGKISLHTARDTKFLVCIDPFTGLIRAAVLKWGPFQSIPVPCKTNHDILRLVFQGPYKDACSAPSVREELGGFLQQLHATLFFAADRE